MAHKILVVDDEQGVREALYEILADEGYEPILAASGEEALELTQKEDPLVILMDVRMSGIDGIETCRRLKRDEKTRPIPIIVTTGFAETFTEACEAGASDFVRKPFDATEIAVRVKSMLRIRHLTDELDRAVTYIKELLENLNKT